MSGSRRLIATACKASTAEHAVVRVYNTDNWQPVGEPLSGHTLTVTRIAFSPDDRLVLTVSRDRSWRLYEAQSDGGSCSCPCSLSGDNFGAQLIYPSLRTNHMDE